MNAGSPGTRYLETRDQNSYGARLPQSRDFRFWLRSCLFPAVLFIYYPKTKVHIFAEIEVQFGLHVFLSTSVSDFLSYISGSISFYDLK